MGQPLEYPQYAIMLNMKDKRSVVIGGGIVATRKVKQLLDSGAEVMVVSPTLTPALRRLLQEGTICVQLRDYERTDLQDAMLVFAATDDEEVNLQIAEDARVARALVNVAHAPQLSDFTNPGVLRYGPIQINVSTGGASPTLTRHIVDKVDRIIDDRLGILAERLLESRLAAQRTIADDTFRHELLRGFGDVCWKAWEQQQPFPEWDTWFHETFPLLTACEEE
ncbi:bifunctional precorrin-2 dehydrogenase/sirohydrochlorin ferrochelatase [Paenibacillus sp. SC116]|uniref:precorrin-2 dehydrogenase/sirohydrochlorin ferrochelatase family protein n=1 Tax=Paenibacillus sp. SC116 TaxID=2968986 RepID=UPI00215AF7C6|nr:bifunctional precorrin-2 dehydrogenase/sirohydrochlorin ferrochelatase [Paenibacillus sp. SC116]MCR8846234.1 bifunctional precorrin-2 dehydrogenase/sirohydrochlorin ferrochelatase [Paenibacillus sp. SC116]